MPKEIEDIICTDNIPVKRMCYFVDEIYEKTVLQAFGKLLNGENVNVLEGVPVVDIHIEKEESDSRVVDILWYANVSTRFHQVHISIPREQMLLYIDGWEYDTRPIVFVKNEFIKKLYS